MSSLNSAERARRPLIGVTGRRSSAGRLTVEPRYRHLEFDMHYSDFPTRLSAEGAIVVQIPYEASGIDLIERLDGIVISGGQDVHPETLGIDAAPTDPDCDLRRDAHEIELISGAVELDTPLLGVCRGMQMLNVALGGTLVPDLATIGIDHRSPGQDIADETHPVRTATDSTVFEIYGAHVEVNSLHHQAVDRLGPHLNACGWAPDGVVEAVEMSGRPIVGIQWHPEWRRKDPVFAWLVQVALARKEALDGVA
ncbi:gamma-glutamyl-gamma-aminobutyrate hydrolase family protein [Rhodococcus erythropolis]|uniref:gamma-glutamyl-gamma-aminobutyrate hydrolase family protein n=1 Tax=Rhodococcus erythropolis TaxID=1833 RepID=UPI0029497640|nr:gamma-glutamyl-gamma-aminobutyrate hydrolase family protein [Rhodococcus erythropolis]MDV6275539.1 gamma-glutamyl-gamma-aminobutyrate hydrolase family protein [Rhodococcus erythropolis]